VLGIYVEARELVTSATLIWLTESALCVWHVGNSTWVTKSRGILILMACCRRSRLFLCKELAESVEVHGLCLDHTQSDWAFSWISNTLLNSEMNYLFGMIDTCGVQNVQFYIKMVFDIP
jgi:hypothetical protein